VKIFDIFGAAFPPPVGIEVKFCALKRTKVPDLNRCNESPLRGEKPDFWPVSKFNTGSLPLRGILSVINTILGRLTLDPAGMHCLSRDDAYITGRIAAQRQTAGIVFTHSPKIRFFARCTDSGQTSQY